LIAKQEQGNNMPRYDWKIKFLNAAPNKTSQSLSAQAAYWVILPIMQQLKRSAMVHHRHT
jgi:hypothetical protein